MCTDIVSEPQISGTINFPAAVHKKPGPRPEILDENVSYKPINLLIIIIIIY